MIYRHSTLTFWAHIWMNQPKIEIITEFLNNTYKFIDWLLLFQSIFCLSDFDKHRITKAKSKRNLPIFDLFLDWIIIIGWIVQTVFSKLYSCVLYSVHFSTNSNFSNNWNSHFEFCRMHDCELMSESLFLCFVDLVFFLLLLLLLSLELFVWKATNNRAKLEPNGFSVCIKFKSSASTMSTNKTRWNISSQPSRATSSTESIRLENRIVSKKWAKMGIKQRA